MSAVKTVAALVILGLSASAFAGTSGAISLTHYESLQRLDVQRLGSDAESKVTLAGPVNMSFDAYGRTFNLQLTPNSNLLSAARDVVGRGVVPYRGKLAGNPDSWVRIVIANGAPGGLIWDGIELFAIERAGFR